jgi:predicted DNA-binding transcriptional regulator YafY
MPANKAALCRYQIINECFTNRVKPYWSLQDLLEKLQEKDIVVSTRTVESDIETMRFDERLGYQAPIRYCTRNRGYHYTDRAYSINKLNLTMEDLEALLIAGSLVKAYATLDPIKNFPTVIQKIIASVNVSMLPPKSTSVPDLLIGNGLPDEFTEIVNLLLQAIREQAVLKIIFKKLEEKGAEKLFFHPYHLHEFANQWYVVGVLESERSARFFHLEQIEAVLCTSRNFELDAACLIPDSVPIVDGEVPLRN